MKKTYTRFNSTLKVKTGLKSNTRLTSKSKLKSKTPLRSNPDKILTSKTVIAKGPVKSKRSKATDISQKVKELVFSRDQGSCVYCGTKHNVYPNAHYIRRSKGGLGIEQNVVSLCVHCHHEFDNGKNGKMYKDKIYLYLKSKYPDWNFDDSVFKKGSM